MSLDAIQQAVADAVRDKDGVLTDSVRDAAIAAAVLRYSTDCPRDAVTDITVPGGKFVPLPDDWSLRVSKIQSVEYPIGATPPRYVARALVDLYQFPDRIEWLFWQPLAAGDVIRVAYTALHRVDGTVDTIPPEHAAGVACLAASTLCGQLATYYATEGASTIAADTTDHVGKTERFRARERDLRAEYFRIVGVPDRAQKPRAASAVAELPPRDQFGGRLMFHPPRRRP